MRSLLFVPADSEKKLLKSLTSGADVLIFDLEDAVSLARKEAAREILVHFWPVKQWLKAKQIKAVTNPPCTCVSTRSTRA
jgi:Citrate lyase beta subunit